MASATPNVNGLGRRDTIATRYLPLAGNPSLEAAVVWARASFQAIIARQSVSGKKEVLDLARGASVPLERPQL
jgi:hypothetical protein